MGEYTGELTYSSRKCRRCLFKMVALPVRENADRKFLPPCLICDFVHEDLIKWEPLRRCDPSYHTRGRLKGVRDIYSEKDKRGENKGEAKSLAYGHDLLDDDHGGYKNR